MGLVKTHLFRPFSPEALFGALPPSVRAVAVLDRTKEPGADGEPLHKDVVATLARDYMSGVRRFGELPQVTGGRFGLSSKEFTPDTQTLRSFLAGRVLSRHLSDRRLLPLYRPRGGPRRQQSAPTGSGGA